MTQTTLLGIAGALRKASTNRLLLEQGRQAFKPGTYLEADLRLPLYDGDLEAEGMPAEVLALHAQIKAADAVLIATPEYNKAPSGVLKNALDWVSRIKENPWQDKPVAIISAAAGRAGGERSQYALRLMLTPFAPRLITGPEVFIANSSAEFDETGKLINPRYQKALDGLIAVLRHEVSRSVL